MKNFDNLSKTELWQLRCQITLNSYYIDDYRNSFGFNAYDVSIFFDGYMDYLFELCKEENKECEFADAIKLDNSDTLYSWFNCYDDLSWIKCE